MPVGVAPGGGIIGVTVVVIVGAVGDGTLVGVLFCLFVGVFVVEAVGEATMSVKNAARS